MSRAGHHAEATTEDVWRSWTGWDRLPEAPLPPPGARVVVLGAHPDDEVLGVGGLLVRLAERGCDLLFVTATDGEASHPDSPTISPGRLARLRTQELDHALARLGHAGCERLALHLPDSAVAGHEAELADRLAGHLGDARLLLAPWRGDGHPDHEAAGRAAALAVRRQAAVSAAVGTAAAAPVLWEFPVWAWHWSAPTDPPADRAAGIPWHRARLVRLDPHERLAKQEAVACFVTQVQPLSQDPADAAVLPPEVLAHFERRQEVVLA